MRPISDLSPDEAGGVTLVLSDIDDTLTTGGYLEASAYQALWRLHRAGIRIVPVTGRPAGWCDLIVRQWPVEAIVGENGAFVFYRDPASKRIKTFTHPSVASGEVHEKLSEVRAAVLAEVPGSRVAHDQFARLYDLAIDFREDPPYLGLDDAKRIKQVCERFGAQAKISSIHVNTWFGDYDKVTTANLFLSAIWGMNPESQRREVLFCGDSPNDEPMFAFFPLSCAVANIREYEHLLEHPPRFVTKSGHGRGFSEAVEILLTRSRREGPGTSGPEQESR